MSETELHKSRRSIRQLFPEKKASQNYGLYLRLIGAFVASFLFSSSEIPSDFSPFGICFCIAVPFEFHFAALTGSLAGYWLSLPFPQSLRYCSALILSSVLLFTLQKQAPKLKKPHIISSVSTVSLCLCSSVYLFLSESSLLQLIFLAAETAVSYIFTFMLINVFLLPSPIRHDSLINKDNLYLVTSVCVFLLCGCGLTLKGFSPVRIFCFTAILFLSYFKGITAGSISGICIGATLSVLPGYSRIFPMMAVGGFAAGAFSGYGQALSAVVFFVFSAVAALFSYVDRAFAVLLGELLTGCLIFALMPPSFIAEIQDYLRKKGVVKDNVSDTAASQGLKTAAHNIYQVCDIITRVSDSLENQSQEQEHTDPFYKMKLYEMRRLLTDQFSSVGDFLNEFANEITAGRIHDPSRSAALKSALKEGGVAVDSLKYFTDKNSAVTVELLLIDRPFDISWKKALNIISIVTSRKFERPEIAVNEASTTLIFRQKLPYRLQIGYSQKSAREGAVCGDTVSIAARVESKGFALISDGMGTGPRAAVDSRMTAGIMKKLLCSGFSFESALKIINSALIVRSEEESLASIDGIETNLFTGETFFYKAGATGSLVRKGDRIATLERASLPLGILRNISFSKSAFTAEAGDIILLFSDGITQGNWDWISDELLSWSTNSMEDLSMHILKLAHLRQEKATADDMTVVAIKLEKNNK